MILFRPVGSLTPLLIDAVAWLLLLAIWLIAAPFSHRTRRSESPLQRLSHGVLIYLGFYLIFDHRTVGPLAGRFYRNNAIAWFGTALTLASIGIALWARITLGRYWSGLVTIKEGHRLITTGPYRIARHPIYTGFVLGALGTALSAAAVDALLGFAMVTFSLVRKLRREEAFLLTEFGDEYRQFQRTTPAAVVPGVF